MKTCFDGLFFKFFYPSIFVFNRKTTIGKHLILFWSLIYVWTLRWFYVGAKLYSILVISFIQYFWLHNYHWYTHEDMFRWTFFEFFYPSIFVFDRKTTIGKHLILFWSLIYVWTYNLYAFTLVNSQRHVLMDFFGFFYQSIYVFDHIITIGKHIILFQSLIYLFLSFSYPIN